MSNSQDTLTNLRSSILRSKQNLQKLLQEDDQDTSIFKFNINKDPRLSGLPEFTNNFNGDGISSDEFTSDSKFIGRFKSYLEDLKTCDFALPSESSPSTPSRFKTSNRTETNSVLPLAKENEQLKGKLQHLEQELYIRNKEIEQISKRLEEATLSSENWGKLLKERIRRENYVIGEYDALVKVNQNLLNQLQEFQNREVERENSKDIDANDILHKKLFFYSNEYSFSKEKIEDLKISNEYYRRLIDQLIAEKFGEDSDQESTKMDDGTTYKLLYNTPTIYPKIKQVSNQYSKEIFYLFDEAKDRFPDFGLLTPLQKFKVLAKSVLFCVKLRQREIKKREYKYVVLDIVNDMRDSK